MGKMDGMDIIDSREEGEEAKCVFLWQPSRHIREVLDGGFVPAKLPPGCAKLSGMVTTNRNTEQGCQVQN